MDSAVKPSPSKSNNNAPEWGSDLIALALRDLGYPYVCLVPGASYRGLHDSIVNFLGNSDPEMIICLHEEHAVAIAHGYAKVTGKPLPSLLHSNVGLLHASMTIFNAWCDRIPLVVVGATGPVDAEKRRPWIDWIHTSADQGAAVRGFVKWDDQPASAGAAVEALRRGAMIATTRPCGPVYINIDSAVQEGKLDENIKIAPADWYQPSRPNHPAPADLEDAKALIAAAKQPVLLCGRASRDIEAWDQRVAFAETIGAAVFGEYNSATTFPRSHPLYAATLDFTIRGTVPDALRHADLVISLDWTDLGGTLEQLWGRNQRPRVISVSNDQDIHRGWNMDYQRLAAADLRIGTTPESFVKAVIDSGLAKGASQRTSVVNTQREWTPLPPPEAGQRLRLSTVAGAFCDATRDMTVTLVSNPLGWPVAAVRCEHPLDYLGGNGGGGVGAGPGIAIGAALALRDHHPHRLPVAILGDGDFLMGCNAIWTAARHNIPLLIITANNRSYYNDEKHQELMANVRGRPVENKWIGQRLDDPPPDIAAIARAQGVDGRGPIETLDAFKAALDEGIAAVRAGKAFVIDVIVTAEYAQ